MTAAAAVPARSTPWLWGLLVLGIASVGLVPGSAQYRTWDGTDAVLSGCSAESMLRPPDRFVAVLGDSTLVSLRYSYGCRTAWAELTGDRSGRATVWVERAADGRRQDCVAGPDGTCSTSQLDDADTTTCAWARDDTAVVRTDCY